MEKLSNIVQPDITIIINIASTHSVFFKEEKDIYIEYSIFNGKHITIINGSYNAVNPLTFIRGLELIDKIKDKQKINRRIAIFGEIREAGENGANFMLFLKEHIIKAKIDILICIGNIIKIL